MVGTRRIDAIARDLRDRLDGWYPAAAPPVGRTVPAPRSGAVLAVDAEGLVDAAERADCLLELVPAFGGRVSRGGPLLRVHGRPERLPARSLPLMVDIGRSRPDPAAAFARLAGLAERAVIARDTAAAERAIDLLRQSLCALAARPLPTGRHAGAAGRLRLILRVVTWDGYLRMALDPAIAAGAGIPRVSHALRAALTELRAAAPPDRRPAVDRRLAALGGRPAYRIPAEIAAALQPARR